MATPIIAGAAVAGAAMLGRAVLLAVRRGGGEAVSMAAKMGGKELPRVPRAFLGGFEPDMSRREALLILGLREGSTRDQIRAAHRRMMRLNHPDTGGSQVLATKVNEAKDYLLSGKRGSSVL
uniref:J domain-containing protein n=1 Tax=Erythrolobus madagascarensis TaxID=708628 RepID=A0A7S0XJ86_9RHOD|mmetsp:Transcript_23/g.49  ORF Transcript_23/g.49 Transcript_23/m.49 type:complete len:122 (+) Transcript_23:67-432(+)